jgi:hypothetical protein
MFEKYQKAARDIPNKKEREEIETMKNQVCFQHCQKIYQFTKNKKNKKKTTKWCSQNLFRLEMFVVGNLLLQT